MKIVAISNDFIKNIKANSKVSYPCTFNGSLHDIFVHQYPCANQVFGIKNKFGIAEYANLSSEDLLNLRKIIKIFSEIKEAADKSVEFGLDLKDTLDKEYGKNNYVFCCIGTSPSGIARTMEFSGVETKYFPISHFRHFEENPELFKTEVLDNKLGKKSYSKILSQQGVTKQKVNKNGKQYLFFDYTFSGSTLKYFEKMIDEFTGINKKNCPNIEFLSLNKKMEDAAASKNTGDLKRLYDEKMLISPYQYSLQKYIEDYLETSKIAKYSGVPHLPYENLHLAEFVADSSITSRLFNFAVIDKLAQNQKLVLNPDNKNSL